MGVMSSTARVLSPTAVAIGASVASEDAEGAYVPLKAFYEAGSEAAKAFYKKAKKAISDGMSEDELYQKHGVYRSEDGDYKVDLPEIKARNEEYARAVTKFADTAVELMGKSRGGVARAGTMKDYLPKDSPVFEYFPELRDTEVSIVTSSKKQPGLLGSYYPDTKQIKVYVPHQQSIAAPATDTDKLKRAWRAFGTLVHEFQHNIQDVKGSKNTGSNSGYGASNKKNLQNDLMEVNRQVRDTEDLIAQGYHTNDDQVKLRNLIEQKMYLENMLNDSDVPHAIYIRELGEAEARSSGMKASLPHDERVQLGVFYPAHQRPMKYDKEGVESAIVSGDLPLLDKEEVLVRVESPRLPGDTEEYALATSDKAKKGKGFVDLPSNAVATALGLDTTRRVLTDGLEEDQKELMDDYVQNRTGFKASDMSYAESDLVTEMPIVGDVLAVADIMSEIGNANPLEGDQPEAVDEFSGVEFAHGGLMHTKAGKEMNKGYPVAGMDCGGLMKDEASMGIIVGVEPESGNEIPAGSTEKEVKDDVPAMLSEGEYVIPADVVRWHGVKHLEMMRNEAKMGLGMMAEDGRVSNHESAESEEYEESEEEGYYPKEEVEVVEAARGSYISGIMANIYGRSSDEDEAEDVAEEVTDEDTATQSAEPKTFYRWSVVLDPITKRYKYVPVLQETVEREVVNEDGTTETVTETVSKVVSPEEFNPEQATRYTVDEQLKEIYQEFGEDDEMSSAEDIEAAGCPEGFTFNANIGACMSNTDSDGEAFEAPQQVQYADQLSTKIAYAMGPASESDLEDMEGSTLSQKAISRMTQPTEANLMKSIGLGVLTGGPMGIVTGALGYAARKGIDAVGAKRAALTRAQELSGDLAMGDTTESGGLAKPEMAYNWAYDVNTASFVPTDPSTAITRVGYNEGAKSEDNPLGLVATGYQDIANIDGKLTVVDPFTATDDEFDALLDSIDAQFATLNTTVGDGLLGKDEDFDKAADAARASAKGAAVREAEEARLAEEARIAAEKEAERVAAEEAAAKAAAKAKADAAAAARNESPQPAYDSSTGTGYDPVSVGTSVSGGRGSSSYYTSSDTGSTGTGYTAGSSGTSGWSSSSDTSGYGTSYSTSFGDYSGGWYAKGGLMSAKDKDKKDSK